uniref:Uncharacterized protein n=1 Tax=Davidia involucrata TaxID=16924 RepID=A0A5B6Z868_DAVIN
MGIHKNNHFKITLIFTNICTVSGFQQLSAMRPLEEEQRLKKGLPIQSLQRGPVPSSGSNPCTYIPGRGTGRCTLAENEMNFAGELVAHAPPAFPDFMVNFAAASKANDTQKKDTDS